jgi:hypothetical protein
MTRILLLTTADSAPARFTLCERLIWSIAGQVSPAIEVRHHLLVQNDSEGITGKSLAEKNPWLDLHYTDARLSLSRARNILLARTLASGELANADIVAFPDDDAWYPPMFLHALAHLFASPIAPDFFICRYGSKPEPAGDLETSVVVPSLLQFVRNASSNTMFMRSCIARDVGFFDEGLGVGTAVPGAEDLDFALRARLASARICLLPRVLVGHRDKLKTLRAKYYAGDLLVLTRHARNDAGHASLALRKLLIGLYLILHRQLSPIGWYRAVIQALRSHNISQPAHDGSR